jgi:hypothetical protein
MTIYVVGYDIHPSQGQTYGKLEEAIKSVGDWWHCLDSTWLVKTQWTAVQVRDHVWAQMYSNDKLLVVAYNPPHSGWYGFTGDCQTWLQNNM